MSYTAAQVNTLFQTILQRPADLAAVQAFAGRDSSQDAQIRTQIETSQEAVVNVDPVVRLYQAAFGRLPDSAGLQANVSTYINGYNATSLATSFLSGGEAAAIYGSANPSVTTAFVQTVYQNALGRTGDATELSYWVSTGKSAGQVLSEIANSQEAVNKTAVPIVSFLDAQATSALNGTGTSVTGSLYNQTATNYTFTTGDDTIVGSVNNDSFLSSNAGVTSTTVPGTTVNTGDTINAGGGLDTLTITGAPAGVPGTINGLEVINVVGTQGLGANLDFSNANGLQLFTLRGDTTGGTTLSLKSGVLAGFDAVGASGAPVAETVTFVGTSTFGSVAVANGAQLGTLTLNNADEVVNVVSTGSSGNSLTNVINNLSTGGTAETINISGDRAVTINAIDTTVTTVNAASTTAGVTVTLGTQNVSVTGGSGNDKFVFNGTLTTADTVVGGSGTDTISLTGADFTADAQAAQLNALNSKVSGVEVLEFTGSAATTIRGGSATGALTNSEITKILFDTSGANALDTVDVAGSARTYAFGTENLGNAQFNLASGNTTVNVALEGQAAVGTTVAAASAQVGNTTFTLNASAAAGTVETINLSSSGAATGTGVGNAAGTITAVSGSTVKITGSTDLTIANATTDTTTGGFTNKTTVDASSFTGKLVVTSGLGGDTFTLGSGADTVNVNFVTNGNDATQNSGQSTYTNLDTINSFTSADSLVLKVNVINGPTIGVTNLIKYDATNAVSFEQALTAAEQAAGASVTFPNNGPAVGNAAYFNYNGNTYVVSNTDTGNTAIANGSTDLVVKITGVQTLTADANGIHGA